LNFVHTHVIKFKYLLGKPNLGRPNSGTMKLSEASVGRSYVVVRVEGPAIVRRRLMDLGLLPRTELKVVRQAPLSDPIEVEVKGYSLSVRRSEARFVEVEEAD